MLNTALADEFRKNDYEVLQAQSGEAGLEIMRSGKPNAVLLDLLLPDKHGCEVLEEAKSDPELQNIPIVIETAGLTNLDNLACADAKADLFLIKSENTPSSIVKRISELLNK